MRVLDLFCGAGLVADGLIAAGCEVVGVDLRPQPRYPAPFIQHDALTLDRRFLTSFEAIWASPPCLKDTVLHESARREQQAHGVDLTEHPDLITPTQKLLRELGLPYVIENVENCDLLKDPFTLCGSMFGLGVDDHGTRFHVERHRKFETNWPVPVPACAHRKPVVGFYGGHARNRSAAYGGRGTKDAWTLGHQGTMRAGMGVGRYLTLDEMSQGIPPAYASHVARHLRSHLQNLRQAA